MANYLKLFDTVSEQNTFRNGNSYVEPHVSCLSDGSNIKYNKHFDIIATRTNNYNRYNITTWNLPATSTTATKTQLPNSITVKFIDENASGWNIIEGEYQLDYTTQIDTGFKYNIGHGAYFFYRIGDNFIYYNDGMA